MQNLRCPILIPNLEEPKKTRASSRSPNGVLSSKERLLIMVIRNGCGPRSTKLNESWMECTCLIGMTMMSGRIRKMNNSLNGNLGMAIRIKRTKELRRNPMHLNPISCPCLNH